MKIQIYSIDAKTILLTKAIHEIDKSPKFNHFKV